MGSIRDGTLAVHRRRPQPEAAAEAAPGYSRPLVTTAYLALGSNLGDRLSLLRAAVSALAGPRLRVVARSGVFETDAVASEPQPPYLNAVVRVETALAPRALLDRCLAVEQALGRVRPRDRQGAARTIDLDLLLHGGTIIDEPGLAVPHPRLAERPFVRVPLAEVALPGLRHPITGEALDDCPPAPGVRPYPDRL
jgi:2-amino-4-hydroxy-6-hydroxymethyldihydropteridine diphosphokinase